MVRIILNLALDLLKNSLIFPGYSIFPKVTSEYPKSFCSETSGYDAETVKQSKGNQEMGLAEYLLKKFLPFG